MQDGRKLSKGQHTHNKHTGAAAGPPRKREEIKMEARALAKRGKIYLMKYNSGLYTVDRITKACGCTLKASENKQEVVDFFASYIKTVRKSKTDFNLEVYGK